ncbi:MAG: peptide deformylase [Elusimicrobiota bacterium]
MKNNSVFEVLKYPSPVLLKKTKPLTEITAETIKIIKKMIETLKKANGIGLAANQVGIPLKILVISCPDKNNKKNEVVLINPCIIKKWGEICEEEGCLSFPGLYLKIKRSKGVRVKALTDKGEPVVIEGEDLISRVLQHEIDHLEGKIFISRLPFFKRLSVKRQIRKKIKKGEW